MTTTTTERTAVPVPVTVARWLLAAVGLSHLAVPIVMLARRDALRADIAGQHPDFDAATVAKSADVALTAAVAFHALLLLLCAVLVWKLGTGRPWIRRLTTVSQLLSVVFGIVSWSSSTMFHAVVPVVGAVQVVVVLLLWLPGSATRFFGRARSAQADA